MPTVEAGDTLVLERHPVYEDPRNTPAYKVTQRVVTSVRWLDNGDAVVRLHGLKWNSFRLTGNERNGWWLWRGSPAPSRYQLIEIVRGKP